MNLPCKRLSFAFVLSGMLAFSGCSQRSSFPAMENVTMSENPDASTVAAGKLLGQMIFDSVAYAIPQEDLLQPFIKEFGDGTVVDKAVIHRVRESKKSKPSYYLVGIGQKNGAFRMMAFQLYASEDNSLYITSTSTKYTVRSDGCAFCLFTFNDNRITGSECQTGGAETLCTFESAEVNNFLKKN